MRKNRIVVIGAIMALVFAISGCGSQIPDMTEEERDAISEYAVELLLKYNAGDDSRLVDLSLLTQEPEPTPKPQATPLPSKEPIEQDEVTATPVPPKEEAEMMEGGDMKSALGLAEGISFEYIDCQLVDEYADQTVEGFVMEAESGNKLLVCNFVFVNDGAQKQSIDMLKDNIKYVFNVDGTTLPCSVTMLSNDLTTYLGILDADEAGKVVVIVEGEEQLLTNAKSIYLEVQRGEAIAVIKIK